MTHHGITHVRRWLPALGLVLLTIAGSAVAAGPPERVLYSFQSGPDGAQPQASLIADKAGNLYGTTLGASPCPSQCGSVFELTRPITPGGAWAETTLHTFSSSDGSGSRGNLAMDAAGNLYGTSIVNVFELTRPITPGGAWAWSVLYTFKPDNVYGYGDASEPYAGVIFGPDGALYGTTRLGGVFGQGTVFRLAPPPTPGGTWTESILYSFKPLNRGDGNNPQAGVVFDQAGNLYGTTYAGGTYYCGTVYRLAPPATTGGAWSERVLYSFIGDGIGCAEANPQSTLVLDKAGNLYSTTSLVGSTTRGTVFRLARPATGSGTWTETDLYVFPQYPTDAQSPTSGVIFDQAGNLYGTTQNGGSPQFGGAVYKLAPPATKGGTWTETVLYGFQRGNDGAYPNAALIFGAGGLLYGTTSYGGSGPCGSASGHLGCGTVFSVAP